MLNEMSKKISEVGVGALRTGASKHTKSPGAARTGNFFTNLKVGKKIGLGSGVILLFLMVVSGVAYFGIEAGNENFTQYRGFARQTNEMGRVQANLLAGQLNVREFLSTNSDEDANEVRKRIQATVEIIDNAKVLFDTPEEIAAVEQASKEIHEYQTAFEEVTKLVHERNALADRLNEIGPKAEKDLSEIMDSAFNDGDPSAAYLAGVTLRDLLLGRLYALRFLDDNKKETADRTIRELTEFDHAAERMRDELQNPRRHELAVEVFELAKEYEHTFEKLVEVIFKRNAILQNTINVLGPKIADEMEVIKLRNKELQDELGPRASAAMQKAEVTAMVVSAVAVFSGILLALFTGRAISRPVVAMTASMVKLAAGDTTVAIPALGRSDEIGQMAEAVQVFKDNAIEKVRMEAEQKEKDERAAQEKRQAMLDLADSLESSVKSIVEGVSSAATEMESTAQSMSATAEETNRQSTTVAAAAEEASTNVQTVATAAEELSSSIEEVGRQVTQSSKVAGAAVAEAEATNTSVKGLAQAAEKIGAVVSLIQDIAEQTNLLALNATIEAARAGEAGKGFAVVASEVKSLANQTAKATEEIGGQIAAIQGSTTEAVTAIGGIGKIIAELDEIASSIAAAVEEQGAATQEIARNVQQAAAGTGDVSSNIGGIAQAAGETGSAAGQVLTAAQELARQSTDLRAEIDKFLQRVRAA